jgi:hypothetical protein
MKNANKNLSSTGITEKNSVLIMVMYPVRLLIVACHADEAKKSQKITTTNVKIIKALIHILSFFS